MSVKTHKPVSCPKCGHEFQVKTRAKLGEGTQRCKSMKRLNKNHMMLLTISRNRGEPMTVTQFSSALFAIHAGRWVRGDKDRHTGKWNHHNIQADLSCLVGADMLCMVEGSVERWNDSLGKYEARPVPKYFMDWLQRQRWETISKNGDVSKMARRHISKRGGLSKEENSELRDAK